MPGETAAAVTEAPLEVRLLGLPDAEDYLALRREALAAEPLAFTAHPEDDRVQDPGFLRARLARPFPDLPTRSASAAWPSRPLRPACSRFRRSS